MYMSQSINGVPFDDSSIITAQTCHTSAVCACGICINNKKIDNSTDDILYLYVKSFQNASRSWKDIVISHDDF